MLSPAKTKTLPSPSTVAVGYQRATLMSARLRPRVRRRIEDRRVRDADVRLHVAADDQHAPVGQQDVARAEEVRRVRHGRERAGRRVPDRLRVRRVGPRVEGRGRCRSAAATCARRRSATRSAPTTARPGPAAVRPRRCRRARPRPARLVASRPSTTSPAASAGSSASSPRPRVPPPQCMRKRIVRAARRPEQRDPVGRAGLTDALGTVTSFHAPPSGR